MGKWVMIPIPFHFGSQTKQVHSTGEFGMSVCVLCAHLSHRTKISIMGPKNSSVLFSFFVRK